MPFSSCFLLFGFGKSVTGVLSLPGFSTSALTCTSFLGRIKKTASYGDLPVALCTTIFFLYAASLNILHQFTSSSFFSVIIFFMFSLTVWLLRSTRPWVVRVLGAPCTCFTLCALRIQPSQVENYRVTFNDCLRGQVDKEEDYRSRGWEFKSSWVPTKMKTKEKGKSEIIWGVRSEIVKGGLGRTRYRRGTTEQEGRGGWWDAKELRKRNLLISNYSF